MSECGINSLKCPSPPFADDPDWTNVTKVAGGLLPDNGAFAGGMEGHNNNNNQNGSWWDSYEDCPLMDMSIGKNRLRLVTEILILIGSLLYLIAALREARFLGYKMFVENLVSGPGWLASLYSIPRSYVTRPNECPFFTLSWTEHRSITGHVPVLVLPNDGRAVPALILFDRDGRPCRRRNNAHHCTIFPLLLQVTVQNQSVAGHNHHLSPSPHTT